MNSILFVFLTRKNLKKKTAAMLYPQFAFGFLFVCFETRVQWLAYASLKLTAYLWLALIRRLWSCISLLRARIIGMSYHPDLFVFLVWNVLEQQFLTFSLKYLKMKTCVHVWSPAEVRRGLSYRCLGASKLSKGSSVMNLIHEHTGPSILSVTFLLNSGP